MASSRCPCHSGQAYETCCQPLHLGNNAQYAAELMRSRYCAYALKNANYLRNTWHSSTRPHDLTEADLQGTKWLMLDIIDTQQQDTHHATVTLKAKFRPLHKKNAQHKTQILHETSHFLFEAGHWFYVDGVMHSEST